MSPCRFGPRDGRRPPGVSASKQHCHTGASRSRNSSQSLIQPSWPSQSGYSFRFQWGGDATTRSARSTFRRHGCGSADSAHTTRCSVPRPLTASLMAAVAASSLAMRGMARLGSVRSRPRMPTVAANSVSALDSAAASGFSNRCRGESRCRRSAGRSGPTGGRGADAASPLPRLGADSAPPGTRGDRHITDFAAGVRALRHPRRI